MEREFADIRDPGVSDLFCGHEYNISGIINAGFDTVAFQTGAWALRIPLITIAQTQILIEVWNRSREMEPRLGQNWKNLQMAVIFGVRYYGKKIVFEKEVHIFRLSTKLPQNRFFWFSPDRQDFWSNPMSKDEVTGHLHVPTTTRAYLTGTVATGWLDTSKGSNFGSLWENKAFIHSTVYRIFIYK